VIVLIFGSTLSIMNKACKSGYHAWCAPMSTVRLVEAVSAIKLGRSLVPKSAAPISLPIPPDEIGAIICRSIMALSSVADIRSITNSSGVLPLVRD
jgi:hypothetical protein